MARARARSLASADICSENDIVYIQSLFSRSPVRSVSKSTRRLTSIIKYLPRLRRAVAAAAAAMLRDTSQEFDPLKAGVARLSLEMIRVVFCPTSDRLLD